MSWLAALLAWLLAIVSPRPAVDLEHPRAAAAVMAARASMDRDSKPKPEPSPTKCQRCDGSGWIRINATTRQRCDCEATK